MKSMTVVLNGPVKGWDRSGQNGRFHYDTKKNTEIKAAIRYASQATAEELGIRLPIPAGKKGYAITLRCIFVPPKILQQEEADRHQAGKGESQVQA